ncbi:MAG: DedA family protein [Methylococcaceae bacterium]|nr:DedA family protein [Methylococcaceae bacterium]
MESFDGLGVWGLFANAFISSTLLPGGSELMLGYLLNKGETPASILLIAATTGNVLGAVSSWLLGFWAARRYPLANPKDPRRRQAVDSLRRWGAPLLLLSWLPVVGDGFCFAAGWLRMSFTISLTAIALGKLGRYAAIVYIFSV